MWSWMLLDPKLNLATEPFIIAICRQGCCFSYLLPCSPAHFFRQPGSVTLETFYEYAMKVESGAEILQPAHGGRNEITF